MPAVDEMYPTPPQTTVTVGGIAEPLEGASRPTFFAGVATVVAKLFAIAGPCRAYFGEKDFQQLLVVRQLAHDLSLPVDVVGCAIVREADGLAMSSRNAYLQGADRAAAPVLQRALRHGAEVRRRRRDRCRRRPQGDRRGRRQPSRRADARLRRRRGRRHPAAPRAPR